MRAATAAAARDLALRTGSTVALVDIGGGLGIPYGPGERDLDIEALGLGPCRDGRRSGRTIRSSPALAS